MLKRRYTYAHDFGLITDGWVATEPTDSHVFHATQKKSLRDGEERLMLAVLEDGVQCFQEYVLATSVREKRLFQEAENWINETDGDYVFSFQFICEHLGFHPGQIRRGLMAWRESRIKQNALNPETKRQRKILQNRCVGRSSQVIRAG